MSRRASASDRPADRDSPSRSPSPARSAASLSPPAMSTESSPLVPARSTTSLGLLRHNLLGSALVGLAQAGLVLFAVVLWRILATNPAGLFTYHPALNSLAVLGFTQGVLLLQPTRTASEKQVGLAWHQRVQYAALPVLLAGSTFIIYNKLIHSAPHFQSAHGKLGLITLVLILVQMTFGALMVYAPLTVVFGGVAKAKALWKFHRASGYIILALLFITPLTAVDSDWVVGHSSKGERVAMVVGLAGAAGGVAARISLKKLGLRS